MLGLVLGVLVILLGLKGFSREGLPLTQKKKLTGTGAKVVGGVCLLVGLAFFAEGAYAFYVITTQSR